MTASFKLDEDNSLLMSAYEGQNYFLIDDNFCPSSSPTCFIYCSSNGIYYDPEDDEKSFRKAILQNNRYEWLGGHLSNLPKANRNIYLRDIWKSWYVKGINSKINSIPKIIELLQKLVKGFEHIVVVGSSSGAYLSAIIGCAIGVDECFLFSPQFSLSHHNNCIETHPLLKKYSNDPIRAPFFEANKVIMEIQKKNKKTVFFYFHPTGVNHDNISSQFSKGISKLYDFPVDCHYHGVCIDKKSLVKVLNWNAKDGIDYSNKWKKRKSHSMISFSFMIKGPIFGIPYSMKATIHNFLAKMYHLVLKK